MWSNTSNLHERHEQINIALFGLGRIGRTHLQNIIGNPHSKLQYIIESDVETAEQYLCKNILQQNDIKIIHVDNAAVIYNDPSIGGVVVATPTPTHEDIVVKSLQAGKTVFCEKPLASEYDQVKHCYEIAKKSDVPLFCAFNRRFDDSFEILRNKIKAGEIGKLRTMRLVSRDPASPSLEYLKSSGGIFNDSMIHTIDLACWLAGEFPDTVYAKGIATHADVIEAQDVDIATAMLTFPSGIIATLDCTRSTTYGFDQRIEAFGSEGMLLVDNHHYTSLQSYNQDGKKHDHIYYFLDRFKDSYVKAMNHFIEVVRGNANTSITEVDVLTGLKIADACLKSQKSGLPVHL